VSAFPCKQARTYCAFQLHPLTCRALALISCRPVIFLSILLVFLFYFSMSTTDHTSTVPVPAEPPMDYHFKYTVQKGFFMQSEDETDDKTFDFVRC
jgi:hypothetical protein